MLYILLQAESPSMLGQLPFLAIMIAIIYFFFLRPTAKKQRAQDEFISQIEVGKEVVTTSGIIGKIKKMSDKEVTLQVSEKTFVRMTRGSISKGI